MTEQLDLLDLIEDETRGRGGSDQRRFATVLTCMRDAMPDTMRFIIDLWAPPDKAWHGSGEWSYWWTATNIVAYPRRRDEEEQSITWEEFADLVRDHPRRASILEWEQSLEHPKWWNLRRPHELAPYGGDGHPSNLENEHAEDGWVKRLTAWTTLQSIFTEAINIAAPDATDFRLPKQEWQRPRGSCRFCREEIIVGSYSEQNNHSPMGTMCCRQFLIRNHAYASYQRMDEAKRGPKAKCRQHQDGRKPCPQQHFEADYERDAARATEVWHGHGWKRTP